MSVALLPLALMASLPSTPMLGIAEGRCRGEAQETALLIDVRGLKDRQGHLKAELYPPNDEDFLADDNILLAAGKTFRRAEMAVPQRGPVSLCLRLPGPGVYALSLLHDRDANRKFGLSIDGIGFANNPRLGLSKPSARQVAFTAGPGTTRISVTMNYRRGLFSFGPIEAVR
ncbi:DUF2141 domain-containing protein [Sphingomonas naphthae]|uniref:DUF2141 domain-containing protein n=1 Tax=Sphingomonas naphthae TaxID=1813468 RepID=A0ABY7TG57_9SPHN|nr:DUF2141 domain-containing protein [Sphingomonas naphthae]WCT72212.1 DUF2141 domain-containing protein [Sphingomonas naphthae]